MHFTKKIDRAFQWAGEKMGGEARTAHSEEFKNLETEMTLRHEGSFNASPLASITSSLTLSLVSQAWTVSRGQ